MVTRDTLVTRCRQMADAVNATSDWPADLVLALAETVLDNEWAQLLASAPWLRTSTRTITLDGTGRTPLASLDGGAGDAAERFFRVREVRIDEREYVFVHPSRVATVGTALYAGVYGWTIDEGKFICLGGAENAVATVRVTHRPALLSTLADGTSLVPFVEGGATLLAMETAALMLMRGARESDEAMKLQLFGEQLRQKLHDAQLRTHSGPIIVRSADDASEWAG